MKIYRVQKENGDGPFNSGVTGLRIQFYLTGPNHPTPQNDRFKSDDKYGGYAYCKLFGCESLEHLQHWFNPYKVFNDSFGLLLADCIIEEDKRVLLDNGFFIAVYDCPDDHIQIGKSKRQVLFDESMSELVDRLSIEKLYEL